MKIIYHHYLHHGTHLGPHAGLYSFYGLRHPLDPHSHHSHHPYHPHHTIPFVPAHHVIPHVPTPAHDPCANLDLSCCPKPTCPPQQPCPPPKPCPTPKPCPPPPPCPKPPPCNSCCPKPPPCDSCCKPCPPCPKPPPPKPCPECPKPPQCETKSIAYVYPTINQHYTDSNSLPSIVCVPGSNKLSDAIAEISSEGGCEHAYVVHYQAYQDPTITPGTGSDDPCTTDVYLQADITPNWAPQYFNQGTPYTGTQDAQQAAAQKDFNQTGSVFLSRNTLQNYTVQYYFTAADGTRTDVSTKTIPASVQNCMKFN